MLMYVLLISWIYRVSKGPYSNFKKLFKIPPQYTHGLGGWECGNKMRIDKSLIIVTVSKEHFQNFVKNAVDVYIVFTCAKLYLFALKLFSHFSETILTLLK